MRTIFIEVLYIFMHQSTQLLRTENQDLGETFTPQTADEALAVRIGAWGAQNLNLSGYICEVCAEFPVIITDQ